MRYRKLPWDSEFFGFGVASVEGPARSDAEIGALLGWLRSERIRCAYHLADPADLDSIQMLTAGGFTFRDMRVTLHASAIPEVHCLESIRAGHIQDLPTLAAIARNAHGDSRFYNDPGFPRERVSDLYAVWVSRSFEVPEARIFVCELGGLPAGYITTEIVSAGVGRISLLAVSPEARGRGFGGGLIRCALADLARRGAASVSIVTQGRNLAAVRLYQGQGFCVESLGIWLHWWQTEKLQEP